MTKPHWEPIAIIAVMTFIACAESLINLFCNYLGI